MQDRWYEITKKPFSNATTKTFKYFMKNIYPKIPALKNAYILSVRVHIDFNEKNRIVMFKVVSGRQIYYITNNRDNPQIVRIVNRKPKEDFYCVKKKV